MKIFVLGLFIILGLSACATKKDVPFYDRANSANDKAVSDLEK
ncbi:MAG: hypothetical protein U9N39_03890 [Campylobacterota bacterium]|nr:hypothetical protein [Campylobacterota bacterium]